MVINEKEYLSKVLGCWMGKNIGGTLGAPVEWRRQINNFSFYSEVHKGEPLPNDDLDIQLIWLVALERRGVRITAQTMADFWCQYVTPHWAEYGIGKINMRAGLLPPVSGTVNNPYKDSCGAFIRSEIWACIAPGCPSVAAGYALQDAILDHGNGEGTYAELFTATIESAAFVESDLRKLIDIGLSYIPGDCGIAKAVRTAIECFDSGKTWQDSRDEILRRHRGACFMNNLQYISDEDVKKGFADGKLGYDAPSNIGILVLGLLYGEGDFDKLMCITVNCGEDTDCTAATGGSIYGIIHGMEGIPQKWIDPIGHGIKTICINVAEDSGTLVPKTIEDLTSRTHRVALQVLRAMRTNMFIAPDKPTDLSDLNRRNLYSSSRGTEICGNLNANRFTFDLFTVEVDYVEGPYIRSNQPKKVVVTVTNEGIQANMSLHVYAPAGWNVSPSADGAFMSMRRPLAQPAVLEFEFTAPVVDRAMNRAALELTIEGRPTVMLVPITLLNGNVRPA